MQVDRFLWIIAVGIYGVGDTLTTFLNLFLGLRELNPLINQYTLIPVKLMVLFLFFSLSKGSSKSRRIVLNGALILIGLFGVTNNLNNLLFSVYVYLR